MLIILISQFAKDVVGLKGQILLFACIIIAFVGVNIVIRRTQKKLKNQLYKMDTDLRENISEELEKEGILKKTKEAPEET